VGPVDGPAASIAVRSSSLITSGAIGLCPLRTRTRSDRISAADWYRLSGFFDSALSTTASSAAGTLGLTSDGRRGSSRTCW